MKIKYFKNQKNIFTIMMFFIVLVSFAQQNKLNGKVYSDDGAPLPGASVLVQGTKQGTVTDFDGNFTINANIGSVLIITYVGYIDGKVVVNSQSNYKITLKSATNTLNEIVVTGYSKEKKSDISGAITVVKVADIAQESSPNILTALQGRVAGLQINSGGTPGRCNRSRPGIP